MTDKTRESTGPISLHFRFPVAKNEEGGEFTHCEEFLDHLGNSEAGGFWPVGRNGLWHGAIHITHASAPWCALSGSSEAERESHPSPFTGQQPLRNMADGEVVAYRVCSDLKEARWWGHPVPHACSFVLIRHYVQPGESKQSGLTFYTLYMNLAPWSAYSNDNAHNWTVNWPSGLKSFADKYRAWRTGTLPCGTKISWDNTDPTLRSEDGGTVMGRVTLRQNVHTSDMELQAGDKVWVSVRDAANLKPEFGGAKRPVWWETLLPPHQHKLELDKVVCPDPIPIKAGDAIGHLGYLGHFSGSRFSMKHEGQYQVHIECFTADDNLAHFLTNPEQVGIDKPAWLKFIPGVTAYEYSGWPMKFEPRKELSTLDAVQRLAGEARSAKDGHTGQLYWCSGQKMDWIRDEDTKKLSRYDLAGQGFELVDIPTTGFKYLGENRSRKGFIRKIMEVLHFASKQEQRTKYGAMEYEYARFLRDIDAEREYDRHHMLSWLYVPMLRHSLNRLIIKHTSAWAYASHAMWEEEHLGDYRKHEPGEAEYWDMALKNEVWIPDLDQSKVNLPAELWHMHPIVFLDAISLNVSDVITLEMVLAANLNESKNQCELVLPYLNKYANIYGIKDKKEIAHFLSQIGHESGFNIAEENLNYSAKGMRWIFGCIKGPSQYDKENDECMLGRLRSKLWTHESIYAHKPERLANYVYANRMGNGGESSGDGYKYRGRGMIQLTGKDGYRFFTNKHNEMNPDDIQDFVLSPDSIVNNIEYGVESAFSFWVSKGLNEKAKTSNVYSVTQVVNGGQNGYADRLKRFNAVAFLLGIDKE